MKLSQIRSRALFETCYDLGNVLQVRASLANTRWSIQRVARYSTVDTSPAKSSGAWSHRARNAHDRAVRRVYSLRPDSPKDQNNGPQIQLVPLLHRLARSLESQKDSDLSNAQNRHLLQSVTSRLQGLLGEETQSAVAGATLKRAEDQEYISLVEPDRNNGLRAISSQAKNQAFQSLQEGSISHTRVQIRRERAYANTLMKKIATEGNIPIRYSNGKTLRMYRDQNATRGRRKSAIRPATGSQIEDKDAEQSMNRPDDEHIIRTLDDPFQDHGHQSKQSHVALFPARALPIRKALDRAERRVLLQLVTNLNEVLSYAASEEEIGFEEKHPSGSSILHSDREEQQASARLFPTTTNSPLSNSSLLAAYIDLQVRKAFLTSHDYDILLLQLFNSRAISYLDRNGYGVEDIIAWAWILTTRSNYDAAVRLLLWTNRPLPASRVPLSIFWTLLKRHITESSVVQLLVVHLWHRLTNRFDSSWRVLYEKYSQRSILSHPESTQPEEASTANYQEFEAAGSSKRLGFFGLRLIKMAAISMPALLPSVATMLCEHLKAPQSKHATREDGISFESSVDLTKQFNDILIKLSTRTTEPYGSVPYQERAQFIVIRRMNDYNPPLVLGHEAYRAVISVQLRHRKTLKERVWTKLKSRGWPPYREDKLGLDAMKKDEVYGTSRAQQAIANLKEAGYAATAWEDAASVLSGWEVDRSPTIQTRKVFPTSIALSTTDQSQSTELSILWESRVASTRTVQEAWAAFLNYMDEDISRTPRVFLVMFKKIASEQDRRQRALLAQHVTSSNTLAGDMPEVFPSSPNPRDLVYTPTPPPTFEEFYQQYRTQFSTIDTQTLCFLLTRAESLEQGFKYIQASDLNTWQRDNLVRHQTIVKHEEARLPVDILTSYIRMLSRYPNHPLPSNPQVSALSHAVHLVCSYCPVFRGPWLFLLKALEVEFRKMKRKVFWTRNWNVVTDIVKKMEATGVSHDSDTFYSICSTFNHLLQSASQGSGVDSYDARNAAIDHSSDLMMQASQLLKRIFKNLVSIDLRNGFGIAEHGTSFLPLSRPDLAPLTLSTQVDGATLLPQLLYVPAPAVIHLFVRLLGSMEDRKAVVDLLEWMSLFDPELQVKVNELASGTRHFRWTLIAVRVIVETTSRPFISGMDLTQMTNSKSDFAIQARTIVEKMESWGGWPDDDEVAEYMEYRDLHTKDESV